MTEQPERQEWLVLGCVGIGTFLSTLNTSITNTILPTIEHSLNISLGQSEWIVLIYLLILTVSLVPIGRLSDLWGHRRIFLLGFALFTAAAVLCGLSGSFLPLFLGRALLAFGGAMILSVGPAILTTTFPPEQRGKVLGLQALMNYIGLSLGPVLSGILTQFWGWQSAFFLTVPFGVAGLFLGLRVVPKTEPDRSAAIDRKGILFFILGMAAVTFLLNSDALTSHRALILSAIFVIFAVSAALFWRTERKTAEPMVHLHLFKIRNFGFGSFGALLNYLCFFLTLFIIPFYLDQILHASALATGILLAITPVIMTVASPIVGALSDRCGSRSFSMAGMAFSTVSLLLFGVMAYLGGAAAWWLLILGLVFAGLGTGTFAAPNNSAIMGAAPRSEQGVASGVLATFRYLGMIAGITLGGSLFDSVTAMLAGRGMGENMAFLQAFAVVMWIGAAFGVAGFFCTGSMSKKPRVP